MAMYAMVNVNLSLLCILSPFLVLILFYLLYDELALRARPGVLYLVKGRK
jgi:hypothetical protein